jgi:hypothetical protein
VKKHFVRAVLCGVALFAVAVLIAACDIYGQVGGADITLTVRADTQEGRKGIDSIMGPKIGVWYSHYGKKRLDGYTIGRWKNIKTVLGKKLDRFEGFDPDEPVLHDKYEPQPDDYYVFYDDTVYGQGEDGSGSGNGGWNFGYMGIVRAVNIFNGKEGAGAIIIEYLEGCYPQWSKTVVNTPLPFFGVYFRVLEPDVIQMANAIVLENLYAGKPYHTETRTLNEAIAKNNAENDGEFISWGVVIPQDRER